jgi:hypothetical protein
LTHQALIREHSIDPQPWRNGLDLIREGAGESGAVWEIRPFQIVSLLDVLKHCADAYFAIGLALEKTRLLAGYFQVKGKEEIPEEDRPGIREELEHTLRHLRSSGLEFSAMFLDQVLKTPEDLNSTEKLSEDMHALEMRVMDELSLTLFMQISKENEESYTNPRKGWEKIIERFANTVTDIEEARKCFALARYTASVFHSLQVVEVGLIELGTFIGVNDPISGWTAVAQRLKRILETKYQDLSQFEKDNRPFIEQVQGTVEALKNAWRNKVSHVGQKLTLMTGEEFHPDVAEEILIATRAFMRRLAEGLPLLPTEE